MGTYSYLLDLSFIQCFPFCDGKSSIFSHQNYLLRLVHPPNKKAISRIHLLGTGWAFSPNNSVEGFSRDQIEYALVGLRREQKICRIYWERG